MSISKTVSDVEMLQYHCYTGIMVQKGERNRRYMLKTVFDDGLGIFILGEARLRHLQKQHFGGITLIHPYKGGSSVAVADSRERNFTQQTGLLTAQTSTPWAPLEIRLAVDTIRS